MRPARNASATTSARGDVEGGCDLLQEVLDRVRAQLDERADLLVGEAACARRKSIKPGARVGKHGAEGGTRTPTGCPTRPSTVRVCQFRHFGPGTGAKYTLTSASAKPSHALTQPRIERVADALAEQVVREHGEEDGEARIDRQPPRELDDFLALVEDVAPRRVRRTHAEAEERQARLGEDGGGNRSEERRVGKECRSRWSPYHLKKKTREERHT